METTGHLRVANSMRCKIGLAAVWAALCLGAVPAQALVVIMDIGWGYNAGSDMDNDTLRSTYALQEGSIVQIIAYDSSAYPSTAFQAGDPNNNFDLFGTYLGPALPGEPNYAPNNEAP